LVKFFGVSSVESSTEEKLSESFLNMRLVTVCVLVLFFESAFGAITYQVYKIRISFSHISSIFP
jgi:hypothetical protein